MTNDEVKKAFINEEPVIYALPKSEPIKCDRIYALVYKRFNDGKIHMSVQVQDSRQTVYNTMPEYIKEVENDI